MRKASKFKGSLGNILDAHIFGAILRIWCLGRIMGKRWFWFCCVEFGEFFSCGCKCQGIKMVVF